VSPIFDEEPFLGRAWVGQIGHSRPNIPHLCETKSALRAASPYR